MGCFSSKPASEEAYAVAGVAVATAQEEGQRRVDVGGGAIAAGVTPPGKGVQGTDAVATVAALGGSAKADDLQAQAQQLPQEPEPQVVPVQWRDDPRRPLPAAQPQQQHAYQQQPAYQQQQQQQLGYQQQQQQYPQYQPQQQQEEAPRPRLSDERQKRVTIALPDDGPAPRSAPQLHAVTNGAPSPGRSLPPRGSSPLPPAAPLPPALRQPSASAPGAAPLAAGAAAPAAAAAGLPAMQQQQAPPQQQQQQAAAQQQSQLRSSGVQVLRGGPRGAKLRERRGGVSASFNELQGQLTTDAVALGIVSTRAAGLKHIGFGPFKRENQDEFFIQVGHYGNQPGANLFCVFDGHGSHGKDAATYSRQVLPALLDGELRKFFARNVSASEPAAADTTKGAVEVLITEVFGETEKSLTRAGVNLASSGTTASVVYQLGNRLWVASAGDSRVILCQRSAGPGGRWRPQALTIDHRPRRPSERERVEAAGARVQPKRLPSGRMVGEPRLWLQEVSSPGLLLSRSLGDLMAATVGCTSDPEITYVTLQPGRDHFVVLATDGVWDVLTNEQVCDIVTESPDPHIACRRVLDAALYEWEERMSADNITVLVVEFDWGELERSTE